MAETADIRNLVDSFASDLAKLVKRASLQETHFRLLAALGDTTPKRRGPGRPRKTAAAPEIAAVPRMKKRGKRTSADIGEMGDALLAHVKANPGQRADQIALVLGTDVRTIRLPMQKLLAEKKVHTQGRRRGTTYFAGAEKAKRKAKRAKPAKRRKAAGRGMLVPRARPRKAKPAGAPVVRAQAERLMTGAS
jgi:hypothetical protein